MRKKRLQKRGLRHKVRKSGDGMTVTITCENLSIKSPIFLLQSQLTYRHHNHSIIFVIPIIPLVTQLYSDNDNKRKPTSITVTARYLYLNFSAIYNFKMIL